MLRRLRHVSMSRGVGEPRPAAAWEGALRRPHSPAVADGGRLFRGERKICDFSLIPGPKPSLPLIGTSWLYYPGGRYRTDRMHDSYEDKFLRYGRVVKEYFGRTPLVHVYDGSDIEQVLRSQGRFPERPINEAVKTYRQSLPDRYKSVGLVNSQQSEWNELRKKLTPILMKPANVEQYLREQNAICDDFIRLLLTGMDSGGVSRLQELVFCMALESICLVCLDRRMGCLLSPTLPEALNLIEAVHQMWKYYQKLYFGFPLWKYLTTEAYRKFARNETYIYDVCNRYIEESVALMSREGNFSLNPQEREISILKALISTPDLDPRDIRTTMIDFIAAGIDNTANTILFTLYQLAKNQECQEKAYAEIRAMMGPQDQVDVDILNAATYLKHCIKETFRLMPTIPNIVRVLSEDVVIQNYRIPAKIPICCHTYVASRTEVNFKDALRFVPERWTREPANPFLVLPFGWGPRMCVGRRIAEQEIAVALVKVLLHFRVAYEGTMDTVHQFLIVPKTPLRFRFFERS